MQVINQQERRDMFWRFFYLYLASFILVGFLVYHNAKVPNNDKVSCKELDLKNLQTQALSNMGSTLMALDQTPKANIATYTSHKAAFEKQSNSFISQIDTAKYRDLFQIYTSMSAYYFAIESKGAASSQIQEDLKKQYEGQLQLKDQQIAQLQANGQMLAAMAAKGGGAAPPPPPAAAAAAGGGGGDGGAKFKLKMSQSATDIEAKIQEIKQSANLNLGDAKCNVDKTRVNQALSALQKTAEVLKSN
jgi:hypothetical protein